MYAAKLLDEANRYHELHKVTGCQVYYRMYMYLLGRSIVSFF
jgi:hypothetical protein